MENTIKFRKQIFEEMMREDKDPKNRENWEKMAREAAEKSASGE